MQLRSAASFFPPPCAPFILLSLFHLGCEGTRGGSGSPPPQPNILFLYADDHAASATGSYGASFGVTSNLDRLASQGMVFERAFCANAICAPARAAVLTGKHGHINGLSDNAQSFDPAQDVFPRRLQGAGYETALFGKWHLKCDPEGFDEWEVLPGQGVYYSPDLRSKDGTKRYQGHVTRVVTDRALDWLENERDTEKPFLLMLQFKAPHRPWRPSLEQLSRFEGEDLPIPPTLFADHAKRGTAAKEQEMTIARHLWDWYDLKVPPVDPDGKLTGPDRAVSGLRSRMSPAEREGWDAAYNPRNAVFRQAGLEGEELVKWKFQRYLKDYLRCIAGVDAQVGRVLNRLKELGLEENTVVVYSSDQGFFLGENGWYDKRFMNEPALQVPLLVRWPGVVAEGARNFDMVQNLDFAPTFLEIAGAEIPNEIQGDSFLPLLRGTTPQDWKPSIYYEYTGEPTHNVAAHYGVRTTRWKLIRWPDLDEWELFDIETDPQEIRSLHDSSARVPGFDSTYVDIREKLKVELLRLRTMYRVPNP